MKERKSPTTDVAMLLRLCVCVLQILKPVNQRAQSRVPPPEDLNLEQAIDGAALDRLMAVEVHTNQYCLVLAVEPRLRPSPSPWRINE